MTESISTKNRSAASGAVDSPSRRETDAPSLDGTDAPSLDGTDAPSLDGTDAPSLERIIINRIEKEGPISFRDFMEICLYYPDLGYYSSPGDKIGPFGDFYTSPGLTPIFGEMLARQLVEMWALLGKQPFTVVEYGAGTGALCRDILQELSNNRELYADLNYCIIEKSAAMREREKKLLVEKVSWYNEIQEIPPVVGCILSNELIDNFPFHRVIMQDELMEVFVGYGRSEGSPESGFTEMFRPAGEELMEYLATWQIDLPRGFSTEINLQARDWIREMAEGLSRGFALTLDYGYSSSSSYERSRNFSTLRCFHRHTVNECPYQHIGEQDITANVNFSALRRWGLIHGLEYCGFTGQAYFLRALGLTDRLRQRKEPAANGADLASLLMNMGNKFKVLIQQKGLERPRLSGLLFPEYLA